MTLKKLKERLLGDFVIDPRHDIIIYDILVRDGFIPVTLLLGFTLACSVIIVRAFSGFYVYNIIHLIYLFFFIFLFYMYRFFPKQGLFRFLIFLMMLASVFLTVTIKGKTMNEYIIVLIFPVIIYNLAGNNNGLLWNSVLGISYIFIMILIGTGIINSNYNQADLATGLVLYLYIAIFAHYAELRHASIEKLLLRQLYYDTASGQPNRKMLLEDISHKMFPALFILRIHNFHDINTFFGYSLGNDLMKFIGERLNLFSASRKMKSYNLSGGEFALITDLDSSAPDIKSLEATACDLIQHISEKEFIHQNTNIPLTPYAGISFYTKGESNLISQANMALHHAIKRSMPYHIHNEDDKDRTNYLENISTLSELNQALNENRITPYYQSILNNKTEIKEKFESLLRVISPDGEPQLPKKYLLTASKTRIYPEITRQMIGKVFSRMSTCGEEFTINISAEDIYNPDFFTFLERMMNSNPSCYNRVILEIIESEDFESYRIISEFIKKSRKCGYRFAIDDFGSGYSNFSHLSRLNIDFIKFDGSLIRRIDQERTSSVIIKNIAGLCRELNIRTIAEFVETESIFKIVRDFGIDYSQGTFIDSPSAEPDSSMPR
jgi:EAL domain-containing protein (putative c-di-GMP-specific phosphodiesterase class I)